MDPDDLIDIGRHLADEPGSRDRGRPRQAWLRRAVSTAYYALFHTMARSCADALVGSTRANRSLAAWRQAYRALDHGHARNQCSNETVMGKFPKEIQNFGQTFVEMQGQRHAADYDPDPKLLRTDVEQLIDKTAKAITEFDKTTDTETTPADRKAFAIYVLLKTRRA